MAAIQHWCDVCRWTTLPLTLFVHAAMSIQTSHKATQLFCLLHGGETMEQKLPEGIEMTWLIMTHHELESVSYYSCCYDSTAMQSCQGGSQSLLLFAMSLTASTTRYAAYRKDVCGIWAAAASASSVLLLSTMVRAASGPKVGSRLDLICRELVKCWPVGCKGHQALCLAYLCFAENASCMLHQGQLLAVVMRKINSIFLQFRMAKVVSLVVGICYL